MLRRKEIVGTVLVVLASWYILCDKAGAEGWVLWESPYGMRELVDQEQTSEAYLWGMQGGYGVGQTFKAGATPLARLDVTVKNGGDTSSGTIKIWKWNTDYSTTVGGTPLFEDSVDLTGADVNQLRSFYPLIATEVGETYYMEFDRSSSAFELAGSGDGNDLYPDGKLRVNNSEDDANDLWFKVYTYTTREVLDQEQEQLDYIILKGGGSCVGQTFKAMKTPLVRIDLEVASRKDSTPGTIKMWKWDTDYSTTTGGDPLFVDTVDMTFPGRFCLRSFYPQPGLDVNVGDTYYVEVSRPSEAFYLGASDAKSDYYTDGAMWRSGVARDINDLWFRTYTTADGNETLHHFNGSDTSLSWTAPNSPGAEVNSTDYFNAVKNYTEYSRNGEANAPQYSRLYTIYDAFLYKVTNDVNYLDNAVELFKKSSGWREEHPNEAVGFEWMEKPGIAYYWIKDSNELLPNDKSMIEELLLDSAEKHWVKREAGVHNRSLGSALTYKLMAELFPDANDCNEWETYADGVWDEFVTNMDTQEDSHHYNYLAWRYILEYSSITGQDANLWSDSNFVELVNRFYEHTAGVGVDAGYGDSWGWAVGWCTPVYLFDKAGTKLNDDKYNWLAYRIFDYHRTHIREVEPWKAMYAELPSLCFAYFDFNAPLTDTQPSAQREQKAACQDTVDSHEHSMKNNYGVGQSFKPTATPLVRLKVKVKNDGDTASGTIKIWKWDTDYETTTGPNNPAIFADVVDLNGPDTLQVRSLYPFVEVEVNELYYMEFDRSPNSFSLAGSHGSTDYYADGKLRWNNQEKNTWDLWFRTYTLSENGSTYGTRLEASPRKPSERGTPMRYYDFGTEQVPDKLVFRSGYGMNDLHMVFNLVTEYGHGHVNAGALCSFVDNGSLIMHDNYYNEDTKGLEQHHSMPIIKRYWGGSYASLDPNSPLDPNETPGKRTWIEHFRDYRRASVGWVSWNDLHGWNAEELSQFYFVKNRFLLRRDRTTFHDDMKAATGAVWHASDVHPTHGDNWYDVYMREPRGLKWTFKNPERYALLYFVERTGYEVAAWKEPSYDPSHASSPYVIYQKWLGDTSEDQAVWFDTLLVPHGDDVTGSQAASNVEVLYDANGGVALEITIEDETWTVVDNPSGEEIDVNGLLTDATYLIARTEPNRAYYVLAHQATVAEVGGTIDLSWATATSMEIGGYDYEHPVSWWRFDESSGTTASDWSGNNDGDVNGASWTTGQIDGALEFDGSGDLVDCGNDVSISDLSTFSISLWFKTDVVPGSGAHPRLIVQEDLSDIVWSFILHGDYSGRLTGRIETSGTAAVGRSNFIPATGEWYHAVMTYDDGGDRKVRVYVDGEEQSYMSQTAGTGTMSADSSVKVAIGNRIGGGKGLDGVIDDVRIYNRALSSDEIGAIYSIGAGE